RFARDLRGRACLTAPSLKGLHRVSAEDVARSLSLRACDSSDFTKMCHPIGGNVACPICRIFGSRWIPGIIRYRDLVSSVKPITESRARTRLSKRGIRRSTETIQFEVLPSGTTFSGQIDFPGADLSLLALSIAGLRSISSIGAASAVG